MSLSGIQTFNRSCKFGLLGGEHNFMTRILYFHPVIIRIGIGNYISFPYFTSPLFSCRLCCCLRAIILFKLSPQNNCLESADLEEFVTNYKTLYFLFIFLEILVVRIFVFCLILYPPRKSLY